MERVDSPEKYKHYELPNTFQLMAWVLGWTIFLSSQLKMGQSSENLFENITFGDFKQYSWSWIAGYCFACFSKIHIDLLPTC